MKEITQQASKYDEGQGQKDVGKKEKKVACNNKLITNPIQLHICWSWHIVRLKGRREKEDKMVPREKYSCMEYERIDFRLMQKPEPFEAVNRKKR